MMPRSTSIWTWLFEGKRPPIRERSPFLWPKPIPDREDLTEELERVGLAQSAASNMRVTSSSGSGGPATPRKVDRRRDDLSGWATASMKNAIADVPFRNAMSARGTRR
jgi:hypothetical protein